MKSSLRCMCLLGSFLVVRAVYGFGFDAHVIAARIAESEMDPAVKAEAQRLLNSVAPVVDEEFAGTSAFYKNLIGKLPELSEFEEAALWADLAKRKTRSSTWHYVNVPVSPMAAAPDFAAYDRGSTHVLSKIEAMKSIVRDRSNGERTRGIALLYLIHLVQDVHQPLHVGSNQDRGGNLTQVLYQLDGMQKPIKTNIHALWDYVMLEQGSETFEQHAAAVQALVTPQTRNEWRQGSTTEWAFESYELACAAYKVPGTARIMPSGALLGDEYRDAHLPVLKRRIAQAGVRLAWLIESLINVE